MKTPEEIADKVWDWNGLDHEETNDGMTWEDFVEWIKEDGEKQNMNTRGY